MSRQAGAQNTKIAITPEMLDAGVEVFEWWETDGSEKWDPRVLVRAMYTAMETSRTLGQNQKS